MSEVRSFFRNCPACGRRFHIKLVSKTLVDDRKEVSEVKRTVLAPASIISGRGPLPVAPLLVEENIPITINVEDFQYAYRCKHCGHTWSEFHEETSSP